MSLTTTENSSYGYFFIDGFESAFKKTSGSSKNECGSTSLSIRMYVNFYGLVKRSLKVRLLPGLDTSQLILNS